MKKLLFITILALFMLAGCVPTVTLVVFNNSGKDVCITALGEKFDLKRQTAIRILTAAESKHSLQVTDFRREQLYRIVHNASQWESSPNYLSST